MINSASDFQHKINQMALNAAYEYPDAFQAAAQRMTEQVPVGVVFDQDVTERDRQQRLIGAFSMLILLGEVRPDRSQAAQKDLLSQHLTALYDSVTPGEPASDV